MKAYVIHSLTTGEIRCTFFGDAAGAAQQLRAGEGFTEGSFNAELTVILGGTPVARAACPGDGWAWDGVQWVDQRSLADARTARWEAVKLERSQRLGGTFTALGHIFQIDLIMVPASSLSAMQAQLSAAPWEKQWTLADDSRVTLDAADMIAVGQAMDVAVDTIWNTSQDMRDAIEAAESVAEVDAVVWPA